MAKALEFVLIAVALGAVLAIAYLVRMLVRNRMRSIEVREDFLKHSDKLEKYAKKPAKKKKK